MAKVNTTCGVVIEDEEGRGFVCARQLSHDGDHSPYGEAEHHIRDQKRSAELDEPGPDEEVGIDEPHTIDVTTYCTCGEFILRGIPTYTVSRRGRDVVHRVNGPCDVTYDEVVVDDARSLYEVHAEIRKLHESQERFVPALLRRNTRTAEAVMEILGLPDLRWTQVQVGFATDDFATAEVTFILHHDQLVALAQLTAEEYGRMRTDG